MTQKSITLSCLAFLLPGMLYAQDVRPLTLPDALKLGIANSKNLKLSQNRIDRAVAQMKITHDNALPTANASFDSNKYINYRWCRSAAFT
jgi:outer membrane protein